MIKVRHISAIVLNVSLIILAWFAIISSAASYVAHSECMEYGKAPVATMTRNGVVCTLEWQGTEYSKLLAEIKSGE